MSACPIHGGGQKTPCLSLFRGRDGRERWHCHSCGAGGDALDLVAAFEGRDVVELIRELARC
jgi:DNA primase